MPRYFFNVLDGRSMPDLDGVVLSDAASARREAVRLCAGILNDAPDELGEVWRMEVLDEADTLMFTLNFSLRPGGRL
ncbi:MAG TPA: hypothetical protein VLI41_14640 [Phenylobacterium sp.]|uniref:DUF6894 family protein n=1 Tax=Phenylobacterium sp. TaxID=1871053 RepID=UPI002C437781|nr:hypothetical protein [Phenylobacterium sp.]HSV04430.1 hypothetical protein [Phenylobacterium sp.]